MQKKSYRQHLYRAVAVVSMLYALTLIADTARAKQLPTFATERVCHLNPLDNSR
jgi:hypothetical protein